MRNMHIKGCRNFVYPTERGSVWHQKSERAFAALQSEQMKPEMDVFMTNRYDTSGLSERMKRRLGIIV